jgi:hypothetical protein
MDQHTEKLAEITFKLRGLHQRLAPMLGADDLAVLSAAVTDLASLSTPPGQQSAVSDQDPHHDLHAQQAAGRGAHTGSGASESHGSASPKK